MDLNEYPAFFPLGRVTMSAAVLFMTTEEERRLFLRRHEAMQWSRTPLAIRETSVIGVYSRGTVVSWHENWNVIISITTNQPEHQTRLEVIGVPRGVL